MRPHRTVETAERRPAKWLHPVSSGAPRWKFGCQRSSWFSSHLPADFKARSTFETERSYVMGERCCPGRPEGGMAFRRTRPPIALAIASRQPMTGASNECRLQGGIPKAPLAQRYAERAGGADSRRRSNLTARGNHMPPHKQSAKLGVRSIKSLRTHTPVVRFTLYLWA